MASRSRKDQDPDYDGGRRKRGKGGKDPNAPKRPLSAFFCFSGEERGKVKAKFPDYTVGQIAKELGERWKNCSNRAKYEALAAKEKQRYDEEMAEYKQNGAKKGPSKETVAAKAKPGPKGSKPQAKKAKVDDDDEGDEDIDDEDDDDEGESD